MKIKTSFFLLLSILSYAGISASLLKNIILGDDTKKSWRVGNMGKVMYASTRDMLKPYPNEIIKYEQQRNALLDDIDCYRAHGLNVLVLELPLPSTNTSFTTSSNIAKYRSELQEQASDIACLAPKQLISVYIPPAMLLAQMNEKPEYMKEFLK